MTDSLGQSQVIPYLLGLTRLGHSITIISAEKKKYLIKEGTQVSISLSASGIKWFPVAYSNAIPGFSQRMNYRRLFVKAFRLQKKNYFDIVHCRSYIPSLIGLQLKRRHQLKFIFDMRGFWADERVEGNLWNLKNPLYHWAYRFFKKKEAEFLIDSDAVVSLTDNAKQEILSWKKTAVLPDKITVIPCCTDLDLFSERGFEEKTKSFFKDKYGITNEDFVISYSGSVGTWYLIDEMLLFFSRLKTHKQNSKFLILTPEIHHQFLCDAVEKAGLNPKDVIVYAARRNEMPMLLSLSNASVFFIKSTFSKKASSPTKMGELMSLGIPVFCNKGIGDVDQILTETNAGILIEDFSIKSFDTAIKKYFAASFSADKIREGAEKFFSLDKGIQQYNHIYLSL